MNPVYTEKMCYKSAYLFSSVFGTVVLYIP
jgi:hypothetical protein